MLQRSCFVNIRLNLIIIDTYLKHQISLYTMIPRKFPSVFMKFFFQTGKNHKDAIQNKQDKVNAKVNRFAHTYVLVKYIFFPT